MRDPRWEVPAEAFGRESGGRLGAGGCGGSREIDGSVVGGG